MAERGRRRVNGSARPIRTKRDRDGAAEVVKKLSGRTDKDSDAEERLAALLKEMDKFDQGLEDPDEDLPDEDGYSGPLRRWSDDD
jgi:hypothetical protein